MYAVLEYDSGWSAANVLGDVVAVLTGETVKASLSASLDQAGSSILTTYSAAGWTLHDSVSATRKVLKAPLADDANQFKFIELNLVGAFVQATLWRLWDAVGHAGTHQAGSGGYALNAESTTTDGMQLFLFANARCLLAASSTDNKTSVSVSSVAVLEHDRQTPCDTPARGASLGYIPVVFSDKLLQITTYSCKSPRALKAQDLSLTVNADFYILTPLGENFSRPLATVLGGSYSAGKTHDAAGVEGGLLTPFGVASSSMGNLGGEVSSLCGIYYITPGFVTHGGTFTKDGVEYVALQASAASDYCLAVKHG
jgi:hypothetical protein